MMYRYVYIIIEDEHYREIQNEKYKKVTPTKSLNSKDILVKTGRRSPG